MSAQKRDKQFLSNLALSFIPTVLSSPSKDDSVEWRLLSPSPHSPHYLIPNSLYHFHHPTLHSHPLSSLVVGVGIFFISLLSFYLQSKNSGERKPWLFVWRWYHTIFFFWLKPSCIYYIVIEVRWQNLLRPGLVCYIIFMLYYIVLVCDNTVMSTFYI